MAKRTSEAIKNIKGSKERVYFSKQESILDLPNLVDHQNTSFQWFAKQDLLCAAKGIV